MLPDTITVQFCPCGHVANLTPREVVKMGGYPQLAKNVMGTKLGAPTFNSGQCEQCKEESQRRDALIEYWCNW